MAGDDPTVSPLLGALDARADAAEARLAALESAPPGGGGAVPLFGTYGDVRASPPNDGSEFFLTWGNAGAVGENTAMLDIGGSLVDYAVAVTGGVYVVTMRATIGFESLAAGFSIAFDTDGAYDYWDHVFAPGTGYQKLTVVGHLAAGQKIKCSAWQNVGAANLQYFQNVVCFPDGT